MGIESVPTKTKQLAKPECAQISRGSNRGITVTRARELVSMFLTIWLSKVHLERNCRFSTTTEILPDLIARSSLQNLLQ